MYETLLAIKNEIGFYYSVIKFLLYFILGSVIIYFLNKIRQILVFFFSKFSLQKLKEKVKFIIKFILFTFASTFIGWLVVKLII